MRNHCYSRGSQPSRWASAAATRRLAAVLCLGLFLPVTAQAREQQPTVLEEVLVVAQKRVQSLQEVPVSVAAFSGEDIELSGMRDTYDLSAVAPGLEVRQGGSANGPRFRIRSIGTHSSNFGLESAVGLYVDGVYRARQGSMINNLLDISSVEILRGPQGTLFGRNTLSGAVLMNTVAPNHQGRDGFAEVTAGNYHLWSVSAASSLSAIEDVLALRASAFSSRRDGYVDDLELGDNSHYDRDRWGVRLQALYTPTASLSLRVIADRSEIDEICCATLVVQDNLRPVAPPPDAPAYVGTDEVVRSLGGTVFTGDRFYDYVTAQSLLPRSENEDSGLSVTVVWHVGDYSVTSITGYRSFESFNTRDVDAGNLDSLTTQAEADQSAWTQELRLDGRGGKLHYVAGLYYFNQDLDTVSLLGLGEDINGVFSHTFGYYAGTNGRFPLQDLPAFPRPPLPLMYPGSGARNAMEQHHEAYAVFGQAEYDLSSALVLTAGLRYTREDKRLDGVFTQGSAPDFTDNVIALPPVLDQFPAIAPQAPVNESLKDDHLTGTLKLTRFLSNDLMIYASYGTGYKAGGTNTERIDPALDYVFGPESSRAFELGLKADFPGRALRLNAALHRTDIEDLQVNSLDSNGFVLQSVGAVDTWGGEVELTWAPSNALTLTAAYAVTEGEVEKWENDVCWVAAGFHTGRPDPGDPTGGADTTTCDRSGDELPFNPDHLVLTANLSFDVAERIDGFLLVEYSRVGEAKPESHDPFLGAPAYELVNARIGLNLPKYDTSATLWGRNILDEGYRLSGIDAIGQIGQVVATPREPATWGVTLRKHF